MRAFYGIASRHDVLAVICAYLFAFLYVFNVLPLMFRFRNQDYTPIIIIVFDLY